MTQPTEHPVNAIMRAMRDQPRRYRLDCVDITEPSFRIPHGVKLAYITHGMAVLLVDERTPE